MNANTQDSTTGAASGSYRTSDGKATLSWELTPGKEGPRFSATGVYEGGAGQCVDSIAEAYPDDATVQSIAAVWRVYHLNDMQAGTPEQTAAVQTYLATGKPYEYAAICAHLKRVGLFQVTDGEHAVYTYGAAWLYRAIPADVLATIRGWSDNTGGKSQYDFDAQAFLVKHGLRFRATLSNTKPAPWNDGDGCGHPHFRVTIWREGYRGAANRLAFDFWNGVGKTETTSYDALACVASDVNTPATFAEFCAEYGSEADSIKALQTFRRADRFAKRLRAFFTAEEVAALEEIR